MASILKKKHISAIRFSKKWDGFILTAFVKQEKTGEHFVFL